MNCKDALDRLSERRLADDGLRQHLASCDDCRTIADWTVQGNPNPEHLQRIEATIQKTWKPVRPRPSLKSLVSLLLVEFLALTIVISLYLGGHGLRTMTSGQCAVYLGALAIGTVWVAVLAVARMLPGTRVPAPPAAVIWITSAVLVFMIWALFPSLNVERFFAGRACLETGGIAAAISALVFVPVLRYGLPSSSGAGAITGFFCGLCGVSVLAIFCGWHTTPHILVWHFGVLPVSTVGGAFIGWCAERVRSRKFRGNP